MFYNFENSTHLGCLRSGAAVLKIIICDTQVVALESRAFCRDVRPISIRNTRRDKWIFQFILAILFSDLQNFDKKLYFNLINRKPFKETMILKILS